MTQSPSVIESMAKRFVEGARCDHVLHLVLADYRIDVRTNNKPLFAWLVRYFQDFLRPEASVEAQAVVYAVEGPPAELDLDFNVKTPEPGKQRIKEEWADVPGGRVVRKRLTGMHFVFGAGHNVAVGPCMANANQVVNFVNNRFIEHKLKQGCLLGHAAGVAWRGAGFALAGFSGMGKSTLALHMMNHGLDFISNDRVLLCREGQARRLLGVAKMPRVNPGTVLNNPSLTNVIPHGERAAFEALPQAELWSLEHKYDAFIDQCYGPDRFPMQADMAGLVLLNWRMGPEPFKVSRIDIARRHDLLPAFMKSTGLFFDEADAPEFICSPDDYIDALAETPVFELSGGADFPGAAKYLAQLLEAAASPANAG